MLIYFRKSQLSLFAMPVHVAGGIRKDGTVVKPHMRMQKVALKPHEQAKLFDHDHEAQPERPVRKIDKFLLKHGGAARMRSMLMDMKPEQRAKLIDAMAHLDDQEPAAVIEALDMHSADLQEAAKPEPVVAPAVDESAAAADPAPEPVSSPVTAAEPVVEHDIVEHVTGRGKTLRGVIRRDLTGHEAKSIDEYTFRKDGGWFIREKHLRAATPAPSSTPTEGKEPAAPARDPREVEAEKAADKAKKQAEKLRSAGEKLIADAKDDMGKDRNTNTAKRAGQAANAEADAAGREAIGNTMINLAGAIESGDALHLTGISTRAAVETLDSMVRRAVSEADRHLTYSEVLQRRGREATPSDIMAVKLPQLSMHGSNAFAMSRDLSKIKGASKLSAFFHRFADRLGADNVGYFSEKDVDTIREALKALYDNGQKHSGWQLRDALTIRDRLARAGITTDHQLRLALAEYLNFRGRIAKPDPIKVAERALVGAKVGMDFFPTPKALASRMTEMAGVKSGMTVLEPSAGNGHLADAARDAGATVDTVEMSSTLRDVLAAKGHTIAAHDFETFEPRKQYDAVIMNPPFSDRKDAQHIMRAYDMVKPGGSLVAIAGEGVFFGSDKKAEAFRAWLDDHGAEVEKLPEKTFAAKDLPASTSVNARLLVLHKPTVSVAATEPVAEVAPPAAAKSGPHEGERNAEGLVFRDGRWRRENQAEVAAAVPPVPQVDPEIEAAEDREDLKDALARDPHSAKSKELLSKVADKVAARDDPLDADNPNSPNYRYADTGYVAGSRKELAADMIRKSAKDGVRVLSNLIDWKAVEENPREAKELITKSNLFGEVDWQALKDRGMQPGAGFLIDRIYAAIGQQPSVDSPQARQDYAIGLQSLRDRLEKASTPAEVTDVLDSLCEEYNGKILTAEESVAYQALESDDDKLYAEGKKLKQAQDVLYNAMNAAGMGIYPAEHAIEKRKRRGWKVKPEHEAELAAKKEEHEAARKRWSDLLTEHKPALEAIDAGRRLISQKRSAMVLAARVRNKLENPLHRAWSLMGDRFIGVLRYRSTAGSNAFANHAAAAKIGRIKDWSWMEKETTRAPRVSKENARFQLKVADSFKRVGGRDVTPDSTLALKKMFNLRDVQSGNWVLRDVASAKFHTEQCAGAFADLADLLGTDDARVSMNGRLAMAFGARGAGAKGWADGAAAAHYEPVQRIINMTKNGGGGALAHEWFHSLDNMAAEAEGGVAAGKDDFITQNPMLLPPGELRDAVVALRLAMFDGVHQATEVVKYTAHDVKVAKHNIDGIGMKPEPARRILAAGDVHKAVAAIDTMFGPESGRGDSPKTKKLARDWRRIAIAYYGGNAEGGELAVKGGPAMSEFAMGAIDLDQGSTTPYWAATHEMAARAFQSWAEDSLEKKGRRNDYLSTLADNKYHFDVLFNKQWKPYPEGEERIKINAAFDRLVAAISKAKTLEKALSLLS